MKYSFNDKDINEDAPMENEARHVDEGVAMDNQNSRKDKTRGHKPHESLAEDSIELTNDSLLLRTEDGLECVIKLKFSGRSVIGGDINLRHSAYCRHSYGITSKNGWRITSSAPGKFHVDSYNTHGLNKINLCSNLTQINIYINSLATMVEMNRPNGVKRQCFNVQENGRLVPATGNQQVSSVVKTTLDQLTVKREHVVKFDGGELESHEGRFGKRLRMTAQDALVQETFASGSTIDLEEDSLTVNNQKAMEDEAIKTLQEEGKDTVQYEEILEALQEKETEAIMENEAIKALQEEVTDTAQKESVEVMQDEAPQTWQDEVNS